MLCVSVCACSAGLCVREGSLSRAARRTGNTAKSETSQGRATASVAYYYIYAEVTAVAEVVSSTAAQTIPSTRAGG